jgi:hypothetical protein
MKTSDVHKRRDRPLAGWRDHDPRQAWAGLGRPGAASAVVCSPPPRGPGWRGDAGTPARRRGARPLGWDCQGEARPAKAGARCSHREDRAGRASTWQAVDLLRRNGWHGMALRRARRPAKYGGEVAGCPGRLTQGTAPRRPARVGTARLVRRGGACLATSGGRGPPSGPDRVAAAGRGGSGGAADAARPRAAATAAPGRPARPAAACPRPRRQWGALGQRSSR